MYQVEKVHKQKSIELKKELLNFVFFSLRMRGEGIVSESQTKSYSDRQRDKQWTQTWYLYYLNEIVIEKFKGIAIDEVCSNAYCFVWDHWEVDWLTVCLAGWLTDHHYLTVCRSQAVIVSDDMYLILLHDGIFFLPIENCVWFFLDLDLVLCIMYIYLSIYSFPNWSGVIFCVITYTLIV